MAKFDKIAAISATFVLMFCSLFWFSSSEPGYIGRCPTIYQHQKDDTCESVAAYYGLSNDQFMSYNPNLNCNSMFVGQWLCLGFGVPLSPDTCQIAYGYFPSDTCDSIAKYFGLPSRDYLLTINPGLNCDNMFQNQWICIFVYAKN